MKWEKSGKEYLCEHGTGHTDFEGALMETKFYKEVADINRPGAFAVDLGNIDKQIKDIVEDVECRSIHGCDGCCSRGDFPGVNREQYVEVLLSNCKRLGYSLIDDIDWIILFSVDKKYINWYKAEQLRKV